VGARAVRRRRCHGGAIGIWDWHRVVVRVVRGWRGAAQRYEHRVWYIPAQVQFAARPLRKMEEIILTPLGICDRKKHMDFWTKLIGDFRY
jgi:hypothetical protein